MECLRSSEEKQLQTAFQNQLNLNLPANSRIAIALSGGMDSAVLLRIAMTLKSNWDIRACHINHGINPQSDQWENFCKNICRDYAIELDIFHSPAPQSMTEAEARALRLDAFSKINADAIILAHHADDQSEGVLFRLLRGTGVKGAAAMQPTSTINHKILLRPWLNIEKKIIKHYAHHCRLRWIEDNDNSNIMRRRNFIRHRVLPELIKSIPDCKKNLRLSQSHFQNADVMLKELADIDKNNATINDDNGGLSVDYFKKIGFIRTRNYLYQHLSYEHTSFSQLHLDEIIRQIFAVKSNKWLVFRLTPQSLYYWQGRLYWDDYIEVDYNFQCEVERSILMEQSSVTTPSGVLHFLLQKGAGLSVKSLKTCLSVRFSHRNQKIQLPNQPRKCAIKLRQDIKIFPWRRAAIPYFYIDDELVSVDGKKFSQSYAAAADEYGIVCDVK